MGRERRIGEGFHRRGAPFDAPATRAQAQVREDAEKDQLEPATNQAGEGEAWRRRQE